MNQKRLEQLREMLAEEPNDPFLIYALATEYLNTDKAKARLYFEILLSKYPDYAGTYYHAHWRCSNPRRPPGRDR